MLESTKLRRSLPGETRKARALEAEWTLKERQGGPQSRYDWLWVPDYLSQRYAGREHARTLENYRGRWRNLNVFFDLRQIHGPAALTHEHCLAFLDWRGHPGVPGVFKAKRNTAIYELKLLGLLMREAIRRDMATKNPAIGLGIHADKPKEKAEMTEEEVAKIRKRLERKDEDGERIWPEWMSICFAIAIAQGCRQKETCLPLSDVDLEHGTITFRKTKGDRPFTTALNPELVPLFQRLKAEKRKMTFEMPKGPSAWWWRFFHREGLGHLCFHSTRVSVVTRLARGGANQAIAMRFVGHASSTVHRIYQRLGVDDLRPALIALKQSHTP